MGRVRKKLASVFGRLRIDKRNLKPDLVSGVVLGVESVPDALASGVLAGVNPLYALYAVMFATPIGAMFASSAFLSVQTTSAMSLVVASVPQISGDQFNPRGLFTLALFTGVFMLVAGFLKLGRLMRFVSHSVMVGFMNGVALLIILGQLRNFTGYSSAQSNKVAQAADLLFHIGHVDLATVAVGLVAVGLILSLERTRLKQLGMVVALVAASILLPLFGWTSVERVSDIAQIGGSFPRPMLPDFGMTLDLIAPALSLAVIGLIQGAGISQSFPNPDGRYPNVSRDFIGQGAANVAAGFFQGMPVGGSTSATALVVATGARTRLANIFAGVVIAVVSLLFTNSVGKLAMPALAALLIVIGFRTLKPAEAKGVWRTGLIQRLVMTMTFALVLLVPLQYAVLAGVALSVLLSVVRQSHRVELKEWVLSEGELPIEQEPPAQVPANRVTVLTSYGSLFYATAPVLEEKLPTISPDSRRAVVIFSLRGKTDLGSSFMTMIARYSDDLVKHGSRLMLAEVKPLVKEQLARAGIVSSLKRRNIFLETTRVGESVFDAMTRAEEWISEQKEPGSSD